MKVTWALDLCRRKAVWGPKAAAVIAFTLVSLACAPRVFAQGGRRAGGPNAYAKAYKLDSELSQRAARGERRTTRVIVEWQPGAALPASLKAFARSDRLGILNGTVLDVPDGMLRQLAAHPDVLRLHFDRPAFMHNYRTSVTIGSRAVQRALGYTGAGVGIAIIDSGVASWHDDLTNRSTTQYPYGNQRVSAFVDFVNGRLQPYDDDGHGTHVAGIIAGNGYDSNGQRAGVAPDASLIVLKVLDGSGRGTISRVIQALDWVLAHHAQYNIRVVNLSVGAAVQESYWTDPLTLAAKRLVDAGVVVVAAAGNLGHTAAGEPLYGGIGAPGNAPWVLTVGASSTNGTIGREDDVVAGFSSRGPSYLDWAAKPDLVAPGVGTVSLAAPGSTFYTTKPTALLPGSFPTASLPYLSLSGTSMAAPVVTGTVALMLQANSSLTPNAIKAILQYTAQDYAYDALTQGAGFLNAVGAIRLSRFFATAHVGQPVPTQSMWSKRIIWGNQRLKGGMLDPSANAFANGTTWGAAQTSGGDNIVWGYTCGSTGTCDNIVWGYAGGDNVVWRTSGDGDNIVWGYAGGSDNIVWGYACGGDDCDNIVWGMDAQVDNIVWGYSGLDHDNIVWGMSGLDASNIVWGYGCSSAECDNIVWGMDTSDNIVWGLGAEVSNIVWGYAGETNNIVWGYADSTDNIVWGMATGGDNIVWGYSLTTGQPFLLDATAGATITWDSLGRLFSRLSDEQIFYVMRQLLGPPPLPALPTLPTLPKLGGL